MSTTPTGSSLNPSHDGTSAAAGADGGSGDDGGGDGSAFGDGGGGGGVGEGGGGGGYEEVPDSVTSCDTSTDGYLMQRACCKLRQRMARGELHRHHHQYTNHRRKYEGMYLYERTERGLSNHPQPKTTTHHPSIPPSTAPLVTHHYPPSPCLPASSRRYDSVRPFGDSVTKARAARV